MSKTIKKNFFAPWSKVLGAMRRAAVLLLVMSLTATTGWAGIIYDVPYIDAEGNEQKASRYYSYKGSVQIAEGKSFKDDKGKAYRGTLTGEQLFAIEGKTLASVPPTPVQYIDENGNEKSIYEYTVLTAEMAANELPGGWYVLENSDPNYTDLSLTNTLWFSGNVNLILADGADMGVVVEKGDAINVAGKLTVYGQSNQTGTLYAIGSENGINAENGIVVNGGCVKAYGDKYGFNGGENGVDIHLKHYNSYILGSSYREPVTVSGLALHGHDNNGIYEGDLDNAQIENMAYQNQLLEPCYVVKFDKGNNTDPEFLAATFNKEGVALVARPDKPTRKDLVFYGWFTLTGSDPADENSYTRFRFDEPVTANTEVMALWKEGIRVTFRMDDGKIPEQPLIVVAEYDENGDAYVAKPEVPTREGYTFLEWVDKPQAECTSGVIRKRFDFTAPVKQNTYVYAKWWKNDPVQYVAYDPDEGKVVTKTVEDYTVLTPWTDVSKGLPAEWYIVVNSNEDEEDDNGVDVRITKQLDFNSETTHIILMDDAQMVVGDDMNSAIHANVLNIYGQSIGSGKLIVNSDSWAIEAGSFNIYGGIVHAFGKLVGIYSYNTAHLYGGYVYVANGNYGIYVNKGDLILDWTRKDDGYNINGYAVFDGGSVIVADGKYFKDSSGNIYYGTLTDAQNEALNGVTLSPATQTEYIQAHFSVNGDGTEYTIHTATGWNLFCDALQDNDTWNRFSGKTVKLGADITVTRMAGGQYHDFCGTFDGQGNTLTVNISSDDITDGSTQYVAPFRYVSNTKADPSDEADSPAAIRNLKVTGTVESTHKSASGLVGGCWGVVDIENCLVSTVIDSHVNGDGSHGGIVGRQGNGTLTIRGCVFDGSIQSAQGFETTHCAGFVGYNNGSTLNISNSLFAPASVSVSDTESATFARGNTPSIDNCYYTQTLGTEQGKQRRSITAGENVTVSHAGEATVYGISGITAYKATGASGDSDPFIAGIVYDDVLYAGSNDEVSLTLSHAERVGYTFIGYTASAGTLDGSTLTMPDEDVTLNAEFEPNTYTIIDVSGTDARGTLGFYSDVACNTAITVAEVGATVYIKVTTSSDYQLSSITAQCAAPCDGADSRRSEQLPIDETVAVKLVAGTTDVYELTMPNCNVEVKATWEHVPVILAIGNGGWASYYHEDGVTYSVSDGTAYYVSSIGESVVNLTAIDGVPAGLPVLISGTAGQSVTLTETATEVEVTDNAPQFKGTATDIPAANFTDFVFGRTYVLYGGKFMLVETNGGIGAHKCWLTLTAPTTARQLNISVEGATNLYPSIIAADESTQEGGWYDLQGRKLSGEPTKQGIYIFKGKKVKR